jgi:peptidoglycan/LPS O-acetylase OafA/YrhL
MIPAGAQVATAPPRLRLDHVDGMRALAALVVYVNHAYAQTWNAYLGVFPTGFFAPTKYFLVAGHLSVTVFIVVSGFCLTLPVVQHGGELRGGILGFFKRRARRILPPYYAAVALCLLLIWTILREPSGTLWDVPLQVLVHPSSILVHLLLFQDLFATGHINYVFWSIAVEWHIYFVMPLLVYSWRRFGASAVVMGALVVGYALTLGLWDTRVSRANPHYLGMFALGMLAAHLARSEAAKLVALRARVPWWLLATVALAFTTGLVAFWDVEAAVSRFPYLDLPIGIMAACTLVAASQPKSGLLTRFLSFRPLVFIGTFSYSLYLMHAPLLQLLWAYVFRPLGVTSDALFIWLMTAGLVTVLLASYGFHLLFEAPFMRPARSRSAEPAMVPSP